MCRFFDKNENSNMEIIKSELLRAINEAKKSPDNMQDFVKMVGLMMARTNNASLNDHHISYVTSRLLDSPQKTMLGTGEGKSYANMLLFACQALLGECQNHVVENVLVMQRNLEDFKSFFENLGLKAELQNTNGEHILTVATAEITLRDQVQQYGRFGR